MLIEGRWRRKVQLSRNELLDFLILSQFKTTTCCLYLGFIRLPLFRLKNTPKRAENAYLSISIFKIFRGSMPPDPPRKARASPSSDRFAITSLVVFTLESCDCAWPSRKSWICHCWAFGWSFGYGRNCLLILSCFLCLLNDKRLDQMLKPAQELQVLYPVFTWCSKKRVFASWVVCQRAYSSVVEHLTADQEVLGSTPSAPSFFCFLFFLSHFATDDFSVNFRFAVIFLFSWSKTLAFILFVFQSFRIKLFLARQWAFRHMHAEERFTKSQTQTISSHSWPVVIHSQVVST